MLRSNSLIQEFLIPLPSFCLTNGVTDLWSHLSQQELWVSDRLVIVNQEELPIGLIYLHSLIPYFNSDEQFFYPQDSLSVIQPQSAIVHTLMQPLQIIPGTLSVREFWINLQQLQTDDRDRTQEWAVVNPEGKLLGLLDTKALLRFLVSEYELEEIKSHKTWGTHRQHPEQIERTLQTEQEFEQTSSANQMLDCLDPQATAAIEQVLEALPWPVKLQTQDGQRILENGSWRQEFGEFSDPQISVASSEGAITQSKELVKPAATRVNHLLTDGDSDPILICSLSNGSEQDWKFFKLPLEVDVSIAQLNWMLPSKGFVKGKNHQDSRAESPGKKLRSPHKNPQPMPKSDLGDRSLASRQQETSSVDRKSQVDSNAPLSWWLIIAQDITEQQKMAKELVAKNADLVQLNRLKDEFLACISHELKTPLTAVLGLSTLLKDQALGPLNERQARYAKMIHQSGQHLMRVVNDILDLTRIETGQLQLNWEPVQIQQICEQAWDHTQETQESDAAGHHRGESSPRFTLEIEPGLNMIVADHLRLRQMLYNLLSNAFKFTDPEGAIGLNVSRWQGWIAFTVWDTGIGIPADKQHLIFQRFQQLENPLTRRFEGTGLGLVLTQGLARAHGGDVTFISKEEKGSQFTILLPSAPSEPGSIQEFPVRDQRLLLIVEAVPQYIEDLNDQLVRLGYRVAISRCGIDALEKARRLQPCVIFVNPLLPLLSGWDLLTLLKSDPQTHQIPVIVTASVVDKKRAKNLQADGCLSLPVSLSEVQEQLEDLVSIEVPETADSHLSKLTILRLTADLNTANTLLLQGLRIQSGQYQILEADDLEQAELLAEIWEPQVLLVESARELPQPQVFFQALSQSPILAKLPIVTMDIQTTEVANQVPGLIIFPCLANDQTREKPSQQNDWATGENAVKSIHSEGSLDHLEQKTGESSTLPPAPYLLQVIQLAAQMKSKPNILAVDLLTLPEFYNPGARPHESSKKISKNNIDNSGKFYSLMDLIFEIKSANLNATIGRSWSEVWQKIHEQSVDLLLLYIPLAHLVTPIINGLKAIAHINHKPPILIVNGQGKLLSKGELGTQGENDKNSAIIDSESLSILKAITTKIVPNSLSKEELLQQIQQLLKLRESSYQHERKNPVIQS